MNEQAKTEKQQMEEYLAEIKEISDKLKHVDARIEETEARKQEAAATKDKAEAAYRKAVDAFSDGKIDAKKLAGAESKARPLEDAVKRIETIIDDLKERRRNLERQLIKAEDNAKAARSRFLYQQASQIEDEIRKKMGDDLLRLIVISREADYPMGFWGNVSSMAKSVAIGAAGLADAGEVPDGITDEIDIPPHVPRSELVSWEVRRQS